MKLGDLVAQLKSRLPLFTEMFTETLGVSSIVHAGTTATIDTDEPHGLKPGDAIHVFGAKTQIAIASITHAGADGVATVTTSVDHDLTFHSLEEARTTPEIEGATEADFNGTFTLLGVANRRVFTMQVDAGAPAAATGSPVLTNGSNVFRRIAGLYGVATTPSASRLTVVHDAAIDLGTMLGTMSLRVKPRIGGSIEAERAFESFTRGDDDEEIDDRPIDPWVYVVLEDSAVSRGKTARNDAVDTQRRGADFQQILLQPISIFVALSAAKQTLARNALDESRDLLRPILRSLLGKRFDSGLAVGAYSEAQFVSYGLVRYDRAVAWFEYRFEVRELITFDDTIGAEANVAFRDVEIQITPEPGGQAPTDDFVPIEVETSLDDTVL